MTSRSLPAVALIALLLALAACANAASSAIEPGDRLRVVVLGAEELSADVSVSPDGSISLPVVGSYKIAGKTDQEAATELKSILRKWVKYPEVNVSVAQKVAWVVVVSGHVMKPGAYATTQHTTLLELVGLAGGPAPNADLESVNLVHSDSKTPEAVNLQAFIDGKLLTGNPSLSNGDIVVVPEKPTLGTVFVLGEVRRVGACQLRQGMRIHDAVGEAGGTTDMADPQAASLKGKDGEPVKFDLVKALAQDPTENKVLSPGDTIYIQPTTGTFNVYGAVYKPGSYSIKQPTLFTDALAMAGGYTGRAKIQNARILRSSQQKSIEINVANVERMRAENIMVLPGDTIVIPERGEKTSIWQVLSAVGALGWLVW